MATLRTFQTERVNKALLKELGTYENREILLNKVVSELKEYNNDGKLCDEALAHCINAAQTMTFMELLHSSAIYIMSDVADWFLQQIKEKVVERYPKIKYILDAEPTLMGDEYYDEYCTLMHVISGITIDDSVRKLKYIDEVCEEITKWGVLLPFTKETKHLVKVDFCGSVTLQVKGEHDDSTIKQIAENMFLDIDTHGIDLQATDITIVD